MAGSRPAAGGGRRVEVAPERIDRWLAGFAGRHGGPDVAMEPDGVRLTGADGAVAECRLPLGWPAGGSAVLEEFVAAARHRWRVGLLLARRGAHAAGVAVGDRLVESKVDTRYVQGRTAAGGWSQQRFARRRDKQARESAQAAAAVAARVLVPALAGLDALVTGGDRQLIETILADPRLSGVAALPAGPVLDVPAPRRAELVEAAHRYRLVRIRVLDPPAAEPSGEL